jgi:hypothetical protein
MISKYGVENSFQLKSVIEKIQKPRNKDFYKKIREKSKKTCLEKYGVDHNMKNIELKQKMQKSYIEKYGGLFNGSNSVKEKSKQTNFQHYGVEWNLQRKDIKRNGKKLHTINYERILEICKEQNLEPLFSKEEFKGNYNLNPIYYKFRCLICNEIIERTPHNKNHILCYKCSPFTSSTSLKEKEIFNFIKSIYSGLVIQNDRKILKPKELDIYLPELKLAIEYNGVYWHGYHNEIQIPLSEFKKNTEWKRLECQKLGIRLINIDDYDYLNKPEIFKRFLQDQILPRQKIGARECEIKSIDTKTARDFCEYYHVNGFKGGSEKFGLYYNDELLIVAIFAKYKSDYECVRLCYKTGYDVIGGWAKIQKHFGKRFLHYVNLKYFPGENKTGCGYRFVGKNILHRNSLQNKTNLKKYCKNIDPNLSDFQNCLNNGYICSFDVGNDIRWYNRKETINDKNT